MHACPICNFPCESLQRMSLGGKTRIRCFRCGEYEIGDLAHRFINDRFSQRQIANLSGYIRENQGFAVLGSDLDPLGRIPTPAVADKAAKLLQALAKEFPEPGARINIDHQLLSTHLTLADRRGKETDFPKDSFPDVARYAAKWMATTWAASPEELAYVTRDFLTNQDLLSASGTYFVITPAGWQRIDELRHSQSQSEKAFVAMSFAEELVPLFTDGIEPGVTAAGYLAVRIDRTEHNNRIDDEIVAAIRQTRFVVADSTNQRQSVYFEAGFALGLGRPLIWTVQKDQLHEVHFDTRQYNFIRWEPENLPTFALALQNRIEATIGKGPLSAKK